MKCDACASDHLGGFSAEIHIHFRCRKNLDKPGVFLFPKVLVCLNCGFSSFTVPESELRELVVSQGKSGGLSSQIGA
jgi:hypothetical protein